ncbi:Zn(2)-C6 fungal-type domain-containing protein [Fusarium sp. Ph1]|nr:Zn(2)-C6 fungal-type domain-containing protein [Fusarium sp. Ph1]
MPGKQAPTRKRRRMADRLFDKLAHFEQQLDRFINHDGSGPALAADYSASPAEDCLRVDTPLEAPSPILSLSQSLSKPAGKMVQSKDGVRYMDSHLGAAIHEELRAIRAMLEADVSLGEETPPQDMVADNLHAAELVTASLSSVQPSTVQAFTLWQLFLDRVNPLTKVIHTPSVQPYVTKGESSIEAVPLNYQALRFAIFTLASMSMSESESQQKLECSRQDAIRDYTQGTEIALRKLDVMKNFDMVALQALVLYLLSLRNRHGKDTAWILTGTALRMAIKMGYHRDGELLGLSPFETEMRRRIWWHIMLQDVTHTLNSALSCSQMPISWDCKMPRNFNDADLFPGSVDPVQPREGPTEMAFCLISYQIAKSILSLESLRGTAGLEIATIWNTEDVAANPVASSILKRYREDLKALDQALMDIERRYVSLSAGKVHTAALSLRHVLISKGREMIVPMMEQPEWGTEVFTVEDNLFKILIIKNELFASFDEQMDSAGFIWYAKVQFQRGNFAVMTSKLHQKPVGCLSDRAWRVVEAVYKFHPELFDMSDRLSMAQAYITLKSWQARHEALLTTTGSSQTPDYINQLHLCWDCFSCSMPSCQKLDLTALLTGDLGQLSGDNLASLETNWTLLGNLDPGLNLDLAVLLGDEGGMDVNLSGWA